MKPPFKVLICGDRNWGDSEKMENVIKSLKSLADQTGRQLIIISGGAPGADTLARIVGHRLDVHVAEVMALWGTRHRGAGPQRNEAMLALGPDACVAFHPDISKSRGTKSMVNLCLRADIDVQIIR